MSGTTSSTLPTPEPAHLLSSLEKISQHTQAVAETAAEAKAYDKQNLAAGITRVAVGYRRQVEEMGNERRSRPYKGLLAYRFRDGLNYFGRERALKKLLDRLDEDKLTVLHAESGAGKTSLLQAGLMPQLLNRGDLPLYLRPYNQNPTPAIKRLILPNLRAQTIFSAGIEQSNQSDAERLVQNELNTILAEGFNLDELRGLAFDLNIDYEEIPGETRSRKILELITYMIRRGRAEELLQVCYRLRPNLSTPAGSEAGMAAKLSIAPLKEFLYQVSGVLGDGVVITILLDQFEEFFTELNEFEQIIFVRELAACLKDENLPVRWVLSLRTEQFGRLANFRPHIRNPFANELRLNRLTRAEARQIADRPLENMDVEFEPGLVTAVLDDLMDGEEIAPPQLQLVYSALYEQLPDGETIILKKLYDAAGGTAGILQNHLDNVLNQYFEPPQRPIAIEVLGALVTSDVRRIIRTKAELAAELTRQNLSELELEAILEQLLEGRLLRVAGEEIGETAYELTHDYLAEKIELTPEAKARKAAQELLQRELLNWKQYHTLMRPQTLQAVSAQREMMPLAEAAHELLVRSALAADVDCAAWLSFVAPKLARRTLLDSLTDDNPQIRLRGIHYVADFWNEDMETAVIKIAANDENAAVRQAGLTALAVKAPAEACQLLTSMLESPDPTRRAKAVRQIEPYLDDAICQRLYRLVIEDDVEPVWQAALTMLAAHAAAPYRRNWRPLKQTPFAKRARLYSYLQTLAVSLPATIRWRFRVAQWVSNIKSEWASKTIRAYTISLLGGGLIVLCGALFWFSAVETGWRIEDSITAVTSNGPRTLALDSQDETILYASDQTPGGLFVSLDGGLSWQLEPNNLWAEEIVKSVAVGAGTVYVLTADSVYIRAGKDRFREMTPDTSANLIDVTMDPVEPDVAFVGTAGDGLWRTQNGGVEWQRVGATDLGSVVTAVSSNGVFVVTITDKGVWWSENDGASWDKTQAQLPVVYTAVTDVAVISEGGRFLIALGSAGILDA
ncbi:MAG: hypothetical protein GY796_06995, partial [Chloroflexi bacterium]|nr:hypothetical protein [Chloroflexota bacterium]